MGLPEPVGSTYMAAHKKASKMKVTAQHPKFQSYEPQLNKPEVKIVKCIGFQKFRYCGENRPGKKYQDKDFLQLALVNLSGKNVKVQIVCFDAERQEEIHPNGLVGRDCDSGVYTKTYPVSKSTQIIRIPYLRTERILTKKTVKEKDGNNMADVFRDRAKILPSPYREKCEFQMRENHKYDTTRVCFGIICTIEGEASHPIFCLSNVVQNASEKTMLKIMKLSTEYVSAQEGGAIDIFTTEDGPPLTSGKCTVSVKVHGNTNNGRPIWTSQSYSPTNEDILYKRVVTYRVPAFALNPATDTPVRATVVLSCVQSGQACEQEFLYQPGADSARRLASIHSNKPLRKRPYVPSPDEYSVQQTNGSEVDIKMRMKEKLARGRQSVDAEPAAAPARSVTKNHVKSNPPAAVPTVTTISAVPTSAAPQMAQAQNINIPLALQEEGDLIMAHDMVTGEIVYISAQYADGLTSTGNLSSLNLLSDAPKAVAVPVSEWNTVSEWNAGIIPSTSGSTTVIHTLDSTPAGRRSNAGPMTRRKSKPAVSPWITDEMKPIHMTPLMNGDVSFHGAQSEHEMKQEPLESGPPILNFNDAVAQGITFSLPSNAILSTGNLPSLTGLFSSGMLDGEGSLLSASVFEMVQPYIESTKSEK